MMDTHPPTDAPRSSPAAAGPGATSGSIGSSGLLHDLLALLPAAVLCLDRQWRVIYANSEAIRITKLTPKQIEHQTFWEIFPESLETDLARAYRQVMETRVASSVELFYEPLQFWADVQILPIEQGLAIYFKDVSIEKEAGLGEGAAQRAKSQVLDAIPDAIVIIDRAWNFSYANPRALQLVGQSSVVGANLFELFPGNRQEPYWTTYHQAMEQGTAGAFEAFYPEPLNTWFQVEARAHEDGIIIFFSDISTRKRAELREQESANRLSQVLDATSDAILSIDHEWRYTYLNGRARALVDPHDRLLGKNIWKEFPLAVGTAAYNALQKTMNERVSASAEIFYPEPINAWIDLHSEPSPDGIVVFFRDITAEREHKETLREQQDLLTAVQKAVLLATWDLDLKSGRIRFGVGSYPVYGHPLDQLTTREAFVEIIHPDHRQAALETLEKALRTGERFVQDLQVIAADGTATWIEARGQAILDDDGVAISLRGLGIDISARKQNEAALLASEERYRVLADLNPQAIWMGDAQGNIIYANVGFLTFIGLSADNLDGLGWLNAFYPGDRDRVLRVWNVSVTTGVDYDIEALLCHAATQEYRYWHLRAAPVRDPSGAVLHWLGVGQDIHDAKITAAALRAEKLETDRQRAEIEAVYETAPIGLALFDPVEFRYLRVNERQAQILGLPKERIMGSPVTELAPIPGLQEMFQQVARGIPIRDQILEGEIVTRPGERRSWSVNYSPIYRADGTIRAISTASIEITQQKKAELALIQSEKLAAVGRLASSISHEINNPLEAITNLLYLIALDEGLPESLKVYVHMAQSELSRVSQIATQTLRFHRQSVAPTPVTPAELVTAVVRLYTGRLANSHIDVDARYATTTKILCFENDIRQVLNNLIANAIDAMRTGGRLIIRAHDSHDYRNPDEPKGRPGVRITIADNGHGMSATTLARLFEPFYTTKDLQGTGLGLWISAGIVDRHQGKLVVRSTQHPERHGTVFTLFLPCEEVTTL